MSLFTPAHLDDIVTETNRYAALCLTTTHKGDGPPPTWETDSAEIKAYFGFTILMAFNKLPDLYDYWSVNPAFSPGSRALYENCGSAEKSWEAWGRGRWRGG